MQTTHRLRTSNEAFFIKIPIFWAWVDNLSRYYLGHLWYFRPINQHPFWYHVSPLSMFSINQPLFLLYKRLRVRLVQFC